MQAYMLVRWYDTDDSGKKCEPFRGGDMLDFPWLVSEAYASKEAAQAWAIVKVEAREVGVGDTVFLPRQHLAVTIVEDRGGLL